MEIEAIHTERLILRPLASGGRGGALAYWERVDCPGQVRWRLTRNPSGSQGYGAREDNDRKKALLFDGISGHSNEWITGSRITTAVPATGVGYHRSTPGFA